MKMCVKLNVLVPARISSSKMLFALIAVTMTFAAADIPRPRGVPLVKASLYHPRSDQSWVCLDGLKTIRFLQINDDYCDCADGSDEPGTAACNNGRFHCPNIGHKSVDIQSTRVNDGICDCCDGSDEWHAEAAKCQNVCSELGRIEEEQRRSQAELHKRGGAKRADLIAKGKQLRGERDARRQELVRRRNEQEAIKAEKEELKRIAEAAETEALDLYKEQQREKEAASSESSKNADGPQIIRYEAETAFVKYDTNKDGFVEVTELMVDMTLDRDRNGIVTVEEAKYFLDERDRIDLDAFMTLSWPRIKPIQMLAEGIFKPPIVEKVPDENEKQQTETKEEEVPKENTAEEPLEDDHEHAGEDEGADEGEEDLYEEEDGDADVGVGTVTNDSAPPPEYDPETQRLIELANAARNAFSEVEREVREIEHEIKEIDDHNAKDYGPNEEFASMDGECFTLEDREYVYTLCPFERASQKPRSGGAETTLGRWDEWLNEGGNKYVKQKYSHGASCWNGPQRSAIVQLKCGLEQKITSVSEPNRCEYFYAFETPAACDGATDGEERMRDEL